MFVAQREIKVVKVGSDKITLYRAGDEIPDFESWDESPRRAHLNLEWVIKVESEESAVKPGPKSPNPALNGNPIPQKKKQVSKKTKKTPKI